MSARKLALFVTAAIYPFFASAATFDAANDFSTAANPSGPWSYGFTTTLGGGFSLYTVFNKLFEGGADTWNRGSTTYPDMYPLVFHNGTNSPFNYGTGSVLPGEIGFHPGQSGSFSVIRWTAPTDGQFVINVSFKRDDSGITDVHVLQNDISVFGAALNAASPTAVFTDSYSLTAGRTIDFVVGYGADRVFTGDTVDLAATISAVPEPSAFWLLALGLPAIAFRRVTKLYKPRDRSKV